MGGRGFSIVRKYLHYVISITGNIVGEVTLTTILLISRYYLQYCETLVIIMCRAGLDSRQGQQILSSLKGLERPRGPHDSLFNGAGQTVEENLTDQLHLQLNMDRAIDCPYMPS